jgi:peptidoglycan/LPS O-acetylase OafA/YrhL
MIRRVLSIVLYILAGLFFYGVCFFSVIEGVGLPFIIFCAVTAILTLVGGLAVMGFQDWRRDAGLVLLSATGLAGLILLSALVSTMPSDISRFLSNPTGVAFIVVLALAGALLVWTSRKPRAVA